MSGVIRKWLSVVESGALTRPITSPLRAGVRISTRVLTRLLRALEFAIAHARQWRWRTVYAVSAASALLFVYTIRRKAPFAAFLLVYHILRVRLRRSLERVLRVFGIGASAEAAPYGTARAEVVLSLITAVFGNLELSEVQWLMRAGAKIGRWRHGLDATGGPNTPRVLPLITSQFRAVWYGMAETLAAPLTTPKPNSIASASAIANASAVADSKHSPAARASASITPCDTVTSDPGTRVFLYFHGGGFALGGAEQYPSFMKSVVLACRNAGVAPFRVLSVDYSLSLHAPEPAAASAPASASAPPHFHTPFPGALRQCLASYLYLNRECGIPGRHIIIGGDSAGGNLALGVMQLVRDIARDASASASASAGSTLLPAALLLVSPWLDLSNTPTASMRAFSACAPGGGVDYISCSALTRLSHLYVTGTQMNDSAAAATATASAGAGAAPAATPKRALPSSPAISVNLPSPLSATSAWHHYHQSDIAAAGAAGAAGELAAAGSGVDAAVAVPATRSNPLLSPALITDFGSFPHTLIWCGGREVFRDDLRAFGRRARLAGVRIMDVYVESAVHVAPLLADYIGTSGAATATPQPLIDFVVDVFRGTN